MIRLQAVSVVDITAIVKEGGLSIAVEQRILGWYCNILSRLALRGGCDSVIDYHEF